MSDVITKHRNIAVFIDHDNINIGCFEALNCHYDFGILMDECKKYGHIVSSKIYLDITRSENQRIPYRLYNMRMETVYSPSFGFPDGNKKSLADPMIICDMMKTLYEKPEVDTFILVSGDKDYVPVIRHISQHSSQKKIVVIGIQDTTAQFMIDECSNSDNAEYLDYVIMHRREEYFDNK
ncbi:uncharacterized LabA/DUF88 family protein [Methanohalophilus levihalophilus]|uniref:NYN domain-containing protein n=1 Tax=Methanohalophilus levihalophilus TaxID=1431282 RepID=UPI001AE1E639|nr:NYN domain-containing protein [Methanohalophilus levihalophilus]MBP2030359.1 uncharacterized LabA/DUF88 family protein [Methanohalophilus levihalophilus]